jgi:hypothetical protein
MFTEWVHGEGSWAQVELGDLDLPVAQAREHEK